MSTILYPSPVFGPVNSRRLGCSLGINLMPADGKVCTFDCLYCECGLNGDHHPSKSRPTREEVFECLEEKLKKMRERGALPDVLTFAGNGEPTAHPCFADIVNDVLSLRDRYCPQARVSVLSNATMLHHRNVVEALKKVDDNIQKLDTVDDAFISLLDRPQQPFYDVSKVIEHLCQFEGHVIIQTMFLSGTLADGKSIDNTSGYFVGPWIDALRRIRPQKVMIYTIARETPLPTLQKASRDVLDAISRQVREAGFECSVAY